MNKSNTQVINNADVVCFCHLRWNFVYQRPQHLLSRYARHTRVFFIEEPVFHDGPDQCKTLLTDQNVWVITPFLRIGETSKNEINTRHIKLLDFLFRSMNITNYLFIYYTPMALKFTGHFTPILTIYDCMDELSAFLHAPAELKLLEREMFNVADIVFTGGHSLFQAKKNQHSNIYPFPSSIEKEHFMKARVCKTCPPDQHTVNGIKFGFYGVLDERFDKNLIGEVASQQPDWQFILIGPVVKISSAELPRRDNIHYLGAKKYEELPQYIAGWDIAVIPFEKNESTRYISPTKTPEYLAAGKPVISTSITDVVTPYADSNLVHIADTADEFMRAAEKLLKQQAEEKQQWLIRVDEFLADNSWDNTWNKMIQLVNETYDSKVNRKASVGLKSVA